MLRAGDNIPKGGSISWYKLDNVGGKASLPEDAIHGIAGQHGGVTGFPQDNIALSQRQDDDSYDGGHSCPTLSPHRLCANRLSQPTLLSSCKAVPSEPCLQACILKGCPDTFLDRFLLWESVPTAPASYPG